MYKKLVPSLRTAGKLFAKVLNMNLDELKKLAGVKTSYGFETSKQATNFHKIEKEQNIQPGTEEWFKLWFSKPLLTGEMPVGFRGRKK
jgi:hypothetical protein